MHEICSKLTIKTLEGCHYSNHGNVILSLVISTFSRKMSFYTS